MKTKKTKAVNYKISVFNYWRALIGLTTKWFELAHCKGEFSSDHFLHCNPYNHGKKVERPSWSHGNHSPRIAVAMIATINRLLSY